MKRDLSVVVIDDSPFIHKAVKRVLVPHGIEVVDTAVNGKEGLEKVQMHMPDFVTLDITMPVMDGLETAEVLLREYPEIKVIMLSAMGDDELIQQAKSLGVKCFLTKPFKPGELLQVINDLCKEGE